MVPASLRDIHQYSNSLMTKRELRVTFKLKTNCHAFHDSSHGDRYLVVGSCIGHKWDAIIPDTSYLYMQKRLVGAGAKSWQYLDLVSALSRGRPRAKSANRQKYKRMNEGNHVSSTVSRVTPSSWRETQPIAEKVPCFVLHLALTLFITPIPSY